MKSVFLVLATALLLPFGMAAPAEELNLEARDALPVAEVDDALEERSTPPYYVTYWGKGCTSHPSKHWTVPYYPKYVCHPVGDKYGSIKVAGNCPGYYQVYYYNKNTCGGQYYASARLDPGKCYNVSQSYWHAIKITCHN